MVDLPEDSGSAIYQSPRFLFAPWKLTWHWTIPMFNRKYIFKILLSIMLFFLGVLKDPSFVSMYNSNNQTSKFSRILIFLIPRPTGSFCRGFLGVFLRLEGPMCCPNRIGRPIDFASVEALKPFALSFSWSVWDVCWETSRWPFSGWWFQIFFYFHPYLGKIPILTNIFQRGWNHQLVFF